MTMNAMMGATIYNGQCIPIESVPSVSFDAFREFVVRSVKAGMRVSSMFARNFGIPPHVELFTVIADDVTAELHVCRTTLVDSAYQSITPDCPQVHLFEREIAEQFNIAPIGHPWLRPVRYSRSVVESNATRPEIGIADFYRVEGEEIHEVAVGPVHAGVIEPGHFRFQCHGETVFHLEIALGYQHRGIEEALIGGPGKATLRQMETVAGDASTAHAWTYCQNIEALSSTTVGARAYVIRGIALELERLANHAGDLGALAGDVGYLPTQAFCGRIRGDFLNMTALLCGSRFGRCLMRPGGVRFELTGNQIDDLRHRLDLAFKDVSDAINLLWETPSVQSRFENTGIVTREQCLELGLVGVAARACGVERDVRTSHPSGVYQFSNIPVATAHYGDVNSRAFVRWLEIRRSVTFLLERLRSMPALRETREPKGLAPDHLAVALVEGWRGEVCHVALTDAAGNFSRYKITDPSFHNWSGLAMALRGQQISDFPLCNKSFNLSYCGFDL
jgi:Ni,Fe-hydrogenase III large subunit